eukprot:3633611-Amphidinium_carterae.1
MEDMLLAQGYMAQTLGDAQSASLGWVLQGASELVLSERPLIISFPDFASADECSEMLKLISQCHD